MKRTKAEPSVAGLLLLVTGMLLLSIVALTFLGRSAEQINGTLLLVLSCAALVCLGAGAVLSSRKKGRRANKPE